MCAVKPVSKHGVMTGRAVVTIGNEPARDVTFHQVHHVMGAMIHTDFGSSDISAGIHVEAIVVSDDISRAATLPIAQNDHGEPATDTDVVFNEVPTRIFVKIDPFVVRTA